MTLNPRFSKAYSAARALGIAEEDVKPVLRNLLKVYDKQWELIEAENYRALIDGYFELKDSKEGSSRKRGLVDCDELTYPPKKLQSRELEEQVSSSWDNSSQERQQEKGELSLTIQEQESTESTESCLRNRIGSGSEIPLSKYRDKGKKPIESYPDTAGVKSCSHTGSSVAYYKQPKVQNEPCHAHIQKVNSSRSFQGKELVKPKTELSINDSRNFPEPIATIYPDTDKRNEVLAGNNSRSWKSNIDITSSALGDVKLTLKCNPSLRQSNFRSPDLDVVLKSMEDKCLRSYKIVEPQFSMIKLLRDLCESYLELGTDSTGKVDTVRPSPRIAISRHNPVHSLGLKKGASSSCTPESKPETKSLSSHREGIFQQPAIPKKLFHNLNDISRGSENVEISLVNEICTESLPKFTYIPQNIVYQNAFLNISLARISDHDCCSRCSGDCLSSSIPCECAGTTGGEFAYTAQGLLKEGFLATCMAPSEEQQVNNYFYCPGDCPTERMKNEWMPERCKGHPVRKFIKECWRKCGCDMKCGNRVVQRGITCKLEVFMTREGKGWGLRTLQDLPKGAFVCEYVGEILTNTELYERNLQSSGDERHTYPVLLDADWGSEEVLKDEEALCLDATIYGNVARFINHRCEDSNLLDIPVEVENPDHHYYHIAFFTTRDVKALEELTWDYKIDFNDHDHPVKAFKCSCKSSLCRGKKLKGSVQKGRR